MPAWLAPVLSGVASLAGSLFTNRSNARQADKAMAFSERMSSTQAQRSAADYEAAGLNRALAYGHQAASPSGVTTPRQDGIGAGVSSAMQARQMMAQIELTKAQVDATRAQADKTNVEAAAARHPLSIMESTIGDEPSWRDEQMAARRARLRGFGFEGAMQPHLLQKAALEALLLGSDVNRRQFMSGLWGSARDLDSWMRRAFSYAPDAAEAGRAWGSAAASTSARSFKQIKDAAKRGYSDFTRGGLLDPVVERRWWNRIRD